MKNLLKNIFNLVYIILLPIGIISATAYMILWLETPWYVNAMMIMLTILSTFIAASFYNNELELRNMRRLTFKIQVAPICGFAIGYVEKCLVILLPFVTIEIYKKP
jgi:tetrahydromethanopterin S-methyltransferase subunit F